MKKLMVADVLYMEAQWDYKANADDPSLVAAKERDKEYSWRCSKCDYSWNGTPRSRFRVLGRCPCCDSNKVIKKGINDVLTRVPELELTYDFDKNSGCDIYSKGLNAEDKVFWKCKECGRSWKSSIASRIKKIDDKYVVVPCRHTNRPRRKSGEVERVSDIPGLMKFWDFQNNTLDPAKVAVTSPDSAHWRCNDCGYSWDTTIVSRYRSVHKCPCCELGLVIKKGVNDLFTVVPEAKESFNFERNKDIIDIDTIGIRDITKVWWKCEKCFYEWESSTSARVEVNNGKYKLRGCRQCYLTNGHKIMPVASVTNLMKFWNFAENKARGLDPNVVSAYALTEASWKCKKCNYTWNAIIKSRLESGDRCPCCDSHRAISPGYNDVLTLVDGFKELLDPEENKGVDFSKLGPKSGETAHFRCSTCGRKWESPICRRTKKENNGYRLIGCTVCNDRRYRKQTFAEEFPDLAERYIEELNECSFAEVKAKDRTTIDFWWRCDICKRAFQSKLNAMIASRKYSTKGCPFCSRRKLLPGDSFADVHPECMDEYSPENVVDPFGVFPSDKTEVKWICRNNPLHKWETSFYVRHIGVGNCPVCNRIKPVKGENTFADIHKEYISWWSPNNSRQPDGVFYDSTEWFKWICPTCHGEFGAYIIKIVSEPDACPYCSNRRVLEGRNSFADKHSEYVGMWSPNNERKPQEVLYNLTGFFKWICPDCQGEFNATIETVVNDRKACPFCNDRQVLPDFNSFAARHKELLKEWDYTNNYLLADPNQIGEKCIIPVWWICMNNSAHQYTMSPAKRIMFQQRSREPCRLCKGHRRKKRHFV